MKDDPFAGIPTHPDPNYLWISPSQDETMERCDRLWKFQSCIKVPKVPKGDADFGTIIHAVIERYQLADDLGRTPEGGIVDLYPPGWDTAQGRTIPTWQKALVPVLIDKALETGVLQRLPGRKIEEWVTDELIPGKVGLRGKVDVLLPNQVDDHKSTGWMKYAKTDKPKSPRYLGKVRQMLDYAHFALAPGEDKVKLRHNLYLRDAKKPEVRKVEVTVTRAQVSANWTRLRKQAEHMLELRAVPNEDVLKIPGPNKKDGCDDFGGCPMEGVCTGIETLEQYTARVTRQIYHQKNSDKVPQGSLFGGMFANSKPTDPTMDIFAQSTPVNGAKPAVVPPTDPTTIAEAPKPAMPWHNAEGPGCRACAKNPVLGINSNGKPCRMCDIKRAKAGLKTSVDFDLDANGEGGYVWVDKQTDECGEVKVIGEAKASEKVEVPERITEVVPEVVDTARVEQVDLVAAQLAAATPPASIFDNPPPSAEVVTEVVTEVVEQAEALIAAPIVAPVEPQPFWPEKEKQDDKALVDLADRVEAEPKPKDERKGKAKGGRPKVGFTLYVNCVPTALATVTLESLFDTISKELAADEGVASYFALDPFKRKDAFGFLSDTFNDRFSKLHIVARHSTSGTDHGSFLSALRSVVSPTKLIEGVSY